MKQATRGTHENRTLYLTALITLIGIGVAGVFNMREGSPIWLAILLLVIFSGLMLFSPNEDTSPRWIHLYLGVQGLIVGGLMLLEPVYGAFPVLYFILSAQAMMFFSPRKGVVWIGVFSLITSSVFLWEEGLVTGVLTVLVYAGGYLFFGVFGYTTKQAESERKKSQSLLEELQVAHQQLQEYVTQAEELAVAQERNRLAREVHDSIGHRLTVAAVQLEGAQRLVPTEPERAVQMVETVREQVREALSELRQTVATLREPLEADLPLPQSFKLLIETFEKGTGIVVHAVLPEELPPLSARHRLALYRTAQEALTNVQRHAGAKRVWLQVDCRDDRIALQVRDDGTGFSNQEDPSGFGLRGMQERAAQLGGKFLAETAAKGGAQISFTLPITVEAPSD